MRDKVRKLEKEVGGRQERAFPIYIGYGDGEEFTVRYRSWPPAGYNEQIRVDRTETYPMDQLWDVVENTEFLPGAPKVLGFELVASDGEGRPLKLGDERDTETDVSQNLSQYE